MQREKNKRELKFPDTFLLWITTAHHHHWHNYLLSKHRMWCGRTIIYVRLWGAARLLFIQSEAKGQDCGECTYTIHIVLWEGSTSLIFPSICTNASSSSPAASISLTNQYKTCNWDLNTDSSEEPLHKRFMSAPVVQPIGFHVNWKTRILQQFE